MKELSLEEIKQIELDILRMFHAFCQENNIRYFLAYGTLLGAIRYKGFIPWDDDVDVLVPREDYDRLIKLYQDSDKYRLYAFERNPKYRFPFAKLCDMDTHLTELYYPISGVVLGVSIDIFPLDNWADNLDEARAEAKYINKNISWLGLTKMIKPRTKNPLKFIIRYSRMVFAKLHGSKHYIKKIIQASTKLAQRNSPYVGVKTWPMWGDGAIMPAEIFSDVVEIEFEGEKFPAPAGYDAYLRCLYGDYMPEPPVEKRKTHHSFKAYQL
jgi:lipopolysaccharide cholinephosphotransferase